LRRSQVVSFFERLDPCLVGMEACAGAHYWARELAELGRDMRLMPPAYVKPYVKRRMPKPFARRWRVRRCASCR
jgi:transposase